MKRWNTEVSEYEQVCERERWVQGRFADSIEGGRCWIELRTLDSNRREPELLGEILKIVFLIDGFSLH